MALLVSLKLARWTGDSILNFYGIGVISSTIFVIYVATRFYRDPAEGVVSTPNLTEAPLVSCLVAVYNEVGHIERCVQSLLEADYPSLEVIIVDDASTDGTTELLTRLAANRSFQLLRLPENIGKKRALTEAARVAGGQFIVFTDSDCIVAPDAITRCIYALRADTRLGAVSGHGRALNADKNVLTKVQDVWYDGQFSILKAAESVFGAVTCVSGPLAVFRREAIINFLPAWADDRFVGREFRFATDRQLTGYVLIPRRKGRRLKQRYANDPLIANEYYPEQHWRVGYVRSARVSTNVPDSLAAFFRQQTRWKKSFVRSFFFTGSFYWRRGPLPAAMYYGHVLWILCAPAMAFRHLVWLPLHGAWFLAALYLSGVTVKGFVWATVYKLQHPRESAWVYRPLMSLMSATVLSWLLPYAVVTLRRNKWTRN